MTFEELRQATDESYPNRASPNFLLALDPGETTGWAYFWGCTLAACGQINTADMKWGPKNLEGLVDRFKPTRIVMEDYRVYAWKAKSHTNAPLITPRLIGCVEMLCSQRELLPFLTKQMAQVAKGFCTDDKLKEWGFYQKTLNPAMKHARDAIRHGAYYLLFNKDGSET